MDVHDILKIAKGVKGGGGQWYARCPSHDDKHQSLSISIGQDGRVLLNCHANCTVEQITAAWGITVQDLFVDKPTQQERPQIVAIYDYGDCQKLRYTGKDFRWRKPDGRGGWEYNRKGIPYHLYTAGASTLPDFVFITEGEKDVDTWKRLGKCAVSGMDGAGKGKWKPEYTDQLQGKTTYIIPDHDAPGREYAAEVAAALHGVAKAVYMMDLSTVWPEIPEHGDTTDLIEHFGDGKGLELLLTAAQAAREWKPTDDDPFLSCFRALDDFEEEEATWLVPGWLPEGQIILMAADGGVGKTSMWCNLIAGISSGHRCILDPLDYTRKPQRVAFLTTEDSVRKKLKKKLRLAGANMSNIITPDFMADRDGVLRGLKFGSSEIARFIKHFRPALCVFDPVQGFVPPDINMGSRNAMRDCMAPLITLGEETGCTFLVVCHTNKRKGAFGRDRIADSADLWDVSRSVLMAGYTEDQGIRYLSNEKNNYAQLQDTLLFTIDSEGQPQPEGTTWKRDREYTIESAVNTSAPKRDDCKDWILHELETAGGSIPSKDMEDKAKLAGYSFRTLRRAKDDLKNSKQIKYFQTGSAKEKVWHIQKADGFVELPADTPLPWTDETL